MNDDLRRTADDGDHQEYEVLAAGWALHALEPNEEERFARHLADCEVCLRSTAELADTLGELAYATPAVEPPPELLDRLRAAVAAEESLAPRTDLDGRAPAAERTEPGPAVSDPGLATAEAGVVVPLRRRGERSVRERFGWLVAAAAAAVLVVLGGWNVSLQRDLRQQRDQNAQSQAILAQLITSGRRVAVLDKVTDKSPVAYVIAQDGKLSVATTGMGPNGPGKSFWLWAIRKDATKEPMGSFEVAGRGMAMHDVGTVPAAMGDVTTFAVSLEPGTATPSKPTSIVAQGVVER